MEQTTSGQVPHYLHQRGIGPTLVFLHYWGGSARTWRPVAQQLEGRDILTLDFRGWGRSRTLPGPYGLRKLADDVLAVVADAGVSSYVLVGHSMGGKVAQLLAATRPAGLRGVVLVASAPAKPPAAVTPEYQEMLSHAYDGDDAVAHVLDHVLTATPLPEDARAQVVEDSRASAPGADKEWPLRGIAEDVSRETPRIDVPVLVIAGERDQVDPLDVVHDNLVPFLPGAEVVVMPAVGHLIPLEAPELLGARLRDFAARL